MAKVPQTKTKTKKKTHVLYLVRHGIAARRGDAWPDDTKRPLTDDGVSRMRKAARGLARLDVSIDVVYTSPLVRARQTAEAIASATGAPLRVERRLSPGATVEDLREALADRQGPVATVGHQPDCSEITLAVTGADPGFKPGAMAELELGPAS